MFFQTFNHIFHIINISPHVPQEIIKNKSVELQYMF